MILLTFTVLVTSAMTGTLKVKWKRLTVMAATTAVPLTVSVFALRGWLAHSLSESPNTAATIGRMHLLRHEADAVVYRATTPELRRNTTTISSLERIRRQGILRVGYHQDSLPYAFFNKQDQLVGLDIDLVYLLAEEVDCQLEFVPFEWATLDSQLEEGQFDFAVSGIAITTPGLARIRFTESYLDVTWALIVPDHRRGEFLTIESIAQMDDLRIGVFPDSYFRKKLQAAFPQAEVVDVASPREFFEARGPSVDVLLYDAEGGSAWTLLHPEFQVVVPKPSAVRQPLAFAVARSNEEFSQFLSQWIVLKKHGGDIDELFNYWILGRGAQSQRPRWSVIRDVLHWVE